MMFLLFVLSDKGVAVEKIEESHRELEKARAQKVEDTVKIGDYKRQIENKEAEIAELKEVSVCLLSYERVLLRVGVMAFLVSPF